MPMKSLRGAECLKYSTESKQVSSWTITDLLIWSKPLPFTLSACVELGYLSIPPSPPPPPPDVLSLSTNAAVTWSSSFTLQVKSLLFTEVLAVSLSYHFSKFDLTVLITKVPAQSLWLQPHTGQPFLLVSYLSSQSLCMPNKCR